MTFETIDTRHGTFNKPGFSNGNTLPYTGVPFGMNYFCLQNQNETNWFFDPTYPIIQGIRMTHQPSPWMGDYSWMVFTPVSGKLISTHLSMLQSSYKVSEAVFNPHKLEVESLRYRVKTTVVPTKRGAKIRLFNDSEREAGFVLTTSEPSDYVWDKDLKQLTGVINQPVNDNKNTLRQYVVFDFSDVQIDSLDLNIFENDQWKQQGSAHAHSVWIGIDTSQKEIDLSVGTSFISLDQARLNLEREVEGISLGELEKISSSEWEEHLNLIRVKDRDKNKEKLFSQFMYRLFLFPMTYYEVDASFTPIHFDTYSESVKNGKSFTNNGFWDTYRTVYPLFSLVLPDVYKDILEGIRHFYNESGHLPKWLSPDERGLMPGTLINAVIADAAVKGLLKDEDSTFFLDAMVKEATTEPTESKFGRAGVRDMQAHGYVTDKEVENVNQTQDNAYSDFCIRQVAQRLDRPELVDRFTKEAFNYQNLFDKTTGFLRGKDSEGHFADEFIPEDWGYDYTEGSAWQNALAFYHDNQGYSDLLGGSENFLKHLVKLANEKPVFDIGNYGMEIHEMSEMATVDFGQIALSNQPSFHIPYLYTYAGKPDYTQHVVKQLCRHAFTDGFEGYPGDEDNGSMSGWAIFSHMGFYPVSPGTDEYVLGIPQFDTITLKLPENKSFKITVRGNLPQNSYVKSIKLNDESYNRLFLKHGDIVKGGEMRVDLSLLPPVRNFSQDDYPYSLTRELKKGYRMINKNNTNMPDK